MKPSDNYLKIVQWSEEDGCYVGTCPGVLRGGVHGVVEEAIELYRTDGNPLPPATVNKDYSGRFVLRVGKELHQALAIRALREGESLNSYCQKILKKAA
jgi:HicB family